MTIVTKSDILKDDMLIKNLRLLHGGYKNCAADNRVDWDAFEENRYSQHISSIVRVSIKCP